MKKLPLILAFALSSCSTTEVTKDGKLRERHDPNPVQKVGKSIGKTGAGCLMITVVFPPAIVAGVPLTIIGWPLYRAGKYVGPYPPSL